MRFSRLLPLLRLLVFGAEVGHDDADLVVGDFFVEGEEEGFEGVGGDGFGGGGDLFVYGVGDPVGDGGRLFALDEFGEVFGDGGGGAAGFFGDFDDGGAGAEKGEGGFFVGVGAEGTKC
jgi:hypothetical protein